MKTTNKEFAIVTVKTLKGSRLAVVDTKKGCVQNYGNGVAMFPNTSEGSVLAREALTIIEAQPKPQLKTENVNHKSGKSQNKSKKPYNKKRTE